THRTPQPDVDAAIDIARTPGRRVQPPFEIRPTPGEVREIQRRSRLESGGLVTISSELAGAGARGDFSLEEAIARARRTQRRTNRRAVHEAPLKKFRKLLVDRGPTDLQFLRQILRMIESLLEQTKDLAARLRGRDVDQFQGFRHPGQRVVSAYFNVLPLRDGR